VGFYVISLQQLSFIISVAAAAAAVPVVEQLFSTYIQTFISSASDSTRLQLIKTKGTGV